MRIVSGTDLNEESGRGQAMHSVGMVRTSVLKFTEIGAFEGKIIYHNKVFTGFQMAPSNIKKKMYFHLHKP